MRKELTNAPAKVFVFITIPPLFILSHRRRRPKFARHPTETPTRSRRRVAKRRHNQLAATTVPHVNQDTCFYRVLAAANGPISGLPAYPQTRQARSLRRGRWPPSRCRPA